MAVSPTADLTTGLAGTDAAEYDARSVPWSAIFPLAGLPAAGGGVSICDADGNGGGDVLGSLAALSPIKLKQVRLTTSRRFMPFTV